MLKAIIAPGDLGAVQRTPEGNIRVVGRVKDSGLTALEAEKIASEEIENLIPAYPEDFSHVALCGY